MSYTSCKASSGEWLDSLDRESGQFVATEAGEYEVSFTGLLKSYGGRRVWATLYKLDDENQGEVEKGKDGKRRLRCTCIEMVIPEG